MKKERQISKHRQLTAIVFTDIVGYSKMMQEDEGKAAIVRRQHRAVFDKLTPEYGGKILQYYGDGTLSIFPSAVAAVECSVEMQKAFQKEPKVPLRIGIHTGDITYSKVEVYGDGLNIASRIESACISGGIFISGKVYDDIKNHPKLSTKNLGHFKFKGLNHPITVHALNCDGIPAPTDPELPHLKESKAKIISINPAISSKSSSLSSYKNLFWLTLALIIIMSSIYVVNSLIEKQKANYFASTASDQVSIAVLPFSNFSDNKEDEYFSDGITEDILTTLSNIKDFRVISRTSVMQYKNSGKSMKQIGRELNALYILEGSVRKSNNKVRIVAQLIDARNDTHLWANTYDREVTEIFEVQSEVAEKIAGTLKEELSPEDYQIIKKKPTENLQAYDFYQQGRKYYWEYNEKDNDIAIQLFEKALEVDSTFALAYAGLGDALGQKANYQKGNSDLIKNARKMSNRAISLDQNCSEGYKALGLSYHYEGETEKALESYNRAVETNPNNEMAISNIALIHQEKGDYEEGMHWAKKAKALNPQHPMSFIRLSEVYESVGLNQLAEAVLAEGIAWNPDNEDLNFKMGDLALKMKNLDKVKATADVLESVDPQSLRVHVLHGKAAFTEKNYRKAQEHYIKAREIAEKKDHAKFLWEIDMGLNFIDLKLNPNDIATSKTNEILSKFLEKEAKHPNRHNQVIIAAIYANLNEEEKALQHLKKASQQGFLDYNRLENDPLFENIRDKNDFILIKNEIRLKAEEIQSDLREET